MNLDLFHTFENKSSSMIEINRNTILVNLKLFHRNDMLNLCPARCLYQK